MGPLSSLSSGWLFAGVIGGVRVPRDSRWPTNDLVKEDIRTEEVREGGALRTTGSDTAVVGCESRHRLEMDGKRRPKRDVKLLMDESPVPDLRLFVDGCELSSPSLRNPSAKP